MTALKPFIAVLFLLPFLSHVAHAQDAAPDAAPTAVDVLPTDRGPALGQGFAFVEPMTAHDGKVYSLKDLHGEKGTALFFNRSLSWCPFCKTQTLNLIENASMLTDAGYAVAVITYDAPSALKKFADGAKPSFALLSDVDSQTIKAFGLLDEAHAPGSFAHGIPHPMIVIVGVDNRVKVKFAEEGYKVRPVLTDVVAALTAE